MGFGQTGNGSGKRSGRQGAPWERRSNVGLWQGIYQTIKAVLFSPEALFSTMTFNGGIREPLAFGLLIGSLGGMFGLFWHFLMLTGGLISFSESIPGQFTMAFIFLLVMVMVPFFVTLGIPLIGGWIGGIWQLIVQIIGLRVIHETSYLRVIFAFLIPVLLILLLAIAAVAALLIFITQYWFT
jgi:hypothetical protein